MYMEKDTAIMAAFFWKYVMKYVNGYFTSTFSALLPRTRMYMPFVGLIT